MVVPHTLVPRDTPGAGAERVNGPHRFEHAQVSVAFLVGARRS